MSKPTQKKLKNIEESLQFEDDSNEVPPKEVFTFNELRSCADLFRMWKKGLLEIHPIYQRDVVWKNSDRTRFIDSLLKRLPIPSLCFSQDAETGKMEVIDGLQRIDTVRQFFDDGEWELSSLDDIDKRISGKKVKDLSIDVINDVENLALPITLLRCDFKKNNHTEYIFTIFRRLNTGGLKLTNQEIRNAIFSGKLNDLLKECNKNKTWEILLRQTTGLRNCDDRFRSIEIVLKFFAFFERSKDFKPGLSNFLNGYMKDHRDPTNQFLTEKEALFIDVIQAAHADLFSQKREKISSAVFEAVLFGIAKNIKTLKKINTGARKEILKNAYKKLLKEEAFSTKALSEGLYRKQKIIERLSLAEKAFSSNKKHDSKASTS